MPQRTRYYPRAILISLLALSAAMPAVCQDTEQREGLRENRPGTYALTNVRVVVSPERTLESATVVVRNGRIAAIGEQVPDDARVLDMSGRTLYPGFIDSYSEVAQPNPGPQGAVYWNPNVTPQLRVADTYAADASTNKKYRSQGIVARLAGANTRPASKACGSCGTRAACPSDRTATTTGN